MFVSEAFVVPARLEAEALGLASLPIVVVPHPMADRSEAEIDAIAALALPEIAKLLTRDHDGRLEYPIDLDRFNRRLRG